MLWQPTETYNGLGYFQRGVPIYVYSGTDQYMSGKYVADGRYRANAVDQQIGVMPLLGALDAIQTPQDMSPKGINADFAGRVANGSKVLRKGYGLSGSLAIQVTTAWVQHQQHRWGFQTELDKKSSSFKVLQIKCKMAL